MIQNFISVFLIIITIVFILLFIDKIHQNKEQFTLTNQVYRVRGNLFQDENLSLVRHAPNGTPQAKNIFVGKDPTNKINNSVDIGTNNTIFIKDGIYLGDKFLGIDEIKNIKYLPYNFKDKMCIGNSCINKHHIKLLKGKIPFTMLSFSKMLPFQVFSAPNYRGWQSIYGTRRVENSLINGSGIKSLKITNSNFILKGWENANFKGESYEFTEDNADVTSIFPEGIKSVLPKSKSGGALSSTCLILDDIDEVGTPYTLYQPLPCDSGKYENGKYFYIVRTDEIGHEHDNEDIHFHEHGSLEDSSHG